MSKILIIYHSQAGSTRKMAEAVMRGALEIEGAVVWLRKAADATLEELLECDGLIIASPEYFGYMAGAIKDFFDRTYEAAKDDRSVSRKPFAIVIGAGNDGTGALSHIERISRGYRFKRAQEPIVSRGPVTEEIIVRCEELGRIMALGCQTGIFRAR
ncbi:MAG: flavodoxin [Deltaproteobacteria bacterium]|nr:flavodoxin [Deltaproteobacteria bacterium]